MNTINLPVNRQVLSHNLLTPLTGILGCIHLLNHEKLPLSSVQKTYFKDIAMLGKELLKFANYLITNAQNTSGDNSFIKSSECKKTKKLSVLLVEDDLIIQKIHSELLKNINCKVDIANNGYEALDMLCKSHDVVLMDIQMPGMDGIQAATKIRENILLKDIPIIAITANPTTEVKEKSKNAKFNAIMQKPVDISELKILLKTLVRKQ